MKNLFWICLLLFWSCTQDQAKDSEPLSRSNVSTGIITGGVIANDLAITNLFAGARKSGGGVIYFPEGIVRIAAKSSTKNYADYAIIVPSNTVIHAEKTVFVSDNNFEFALRGDNIKWHGGTIKRGRMDIRGSGILVSGLTIDSSWYHAFLLNGGNRNERDSLLHKVYQNDTLLNCTATAAARHGFALHHGTGGFTVSVDSSFLGIFRNILIKGCKAISPGREGLSQYDYGFGVEDCRDAQNVIFDSCYAYKSPGAGFHIEYHHPLLMGGITIKNSYADSCGTDPTGYPFGFMYRGGMSFINCHGRPGPNTKAIFWHDQAFKGSLPYSFKDCGEDGFENFSYTPGIDDVRFELKPGTNGALTGSLPNLQGAAAMPMKGITRKNIVSDSGYFYNKTLSFTSTATRENSIGAQPVRIDPAKSYRVKVTSKTLSGTRGNLYLYLQEYDGQDQLIKSGYNYMARVLIPSIPLFTSTVVNLGRGALWGKMTVKSSGKAEFNKNTRWLKANLILVDSANFNKRYAVKEFIIEPIL